MRTRKLWTAEQDDYLRANYERADVFASAIAETLGRSASSVHNRAALLGLHKPHEFRSIAGKIGTQSEAAKAHRFKKGGIPANKGKRMSPEMYARCAGTMFKKGNQPVNHREVGSERINVDGYVEIKVAEPNKWRLKHRVVWEQYNGAIPAGMNIQFKNGDSKDVRIENLYIISRAEQMRTENSMIARYPQELVDVIRMRGSVKRSITMYNKKNSKSNE